MMRPLHYKPQKARGVRTIRDEFQSHLFLWALQETALRVPGVEQPCSILPSTAYIKLMGSYRQVIDQAISEGLLREQLLRGLSRELAPWLTDRPKRGYVLLYPRIVAPEAHPGLVFEAKMLERVRRLIDFYKPTK